MNFTDTDAKDGYYFQLQTAIPRFWKHSVVLKHTLDRKFAKKSHIVSGSESGGINDVLLMHIAVFFPAVLFFLSPQYFSFGQDHAHYQIQFEYEYNCEYLKY